jgi:small nuclear ribonucleoprotein (snRNP)-like protein
VRFWTFAVIGTLKGFDQLMNVVLDDVKEVMRGTSPAWAREYA